MSAGPNVVPAVAGLLAKSLPGYEQVSAELLLSGQESAS
jgi:hypothetical protein